MTQNIEQRTEVAVKKYEGSADTVEKIAQTDSNVPTAAGERKSFPKISREWEENSQHLQKEWGNESQRLQTEWNNDSATIRQDWQTERNELSTKALGVKPWDAGQSETNINQQRRWTDSHTYLPKTVPALMDASGPDDNWIPYTADKADTLKDVFGRKPLDLLPGSILQPNAKKQYPKLNALGDVWELADSDKTLTVKSFVKDPNGALVITLDDDSNVMAQKMEGASREHVKTSILVANENAAKTVIDQNGNDWFIDNGFLVTPLALANEYRIQAGVGYVSGFRVDLNFDRTVHVSETPRPIYIYIDAHLESNTTGEWETKFDFVISTDEKDDYIDGQGIKHFVCKIGNVLADGTVEDLRPRSHVGNIFDGRAMLGSSNARVDPMVTSSHPEGQGPKIERSLSTFSPIKLFVDPGVGNDKNSGVTELSPLRTIAEAFQRIPFNVYHPVRVYLLDGDYSGDNIRLYNHYVSPRSQSEGSIKIWGHCAEHDGEKHPIYTDDKPENVILTEDHAISGVNGTEEITILGVKFLNSWLQHVDCLVNTYKCKFKGGYDVPGYRPKICFTGHYCTLVATLCEFDDVAAVIDAENHVHALFDTCTVTNIVDSPAFPGVYGYPVRANNSSRVNIKNSPTFTAPGYEGRHNVPMNGSEIFSSVYSNIGNNAINRHLADESLELQGGNGGGVGQARGAGLSLRGRNHPTDPGGAVFEFGPSNAAKAVVRYTNDNGSLDVGLFTRNGDFKALTHLAFGRGGTPAATLLNNSEAMLYTSYNGDVYVVSRNDQGQLKYKRLFEFSTGTDV